MLYSNAEIVKELEKRGYEAKEDVIVKNSVEFNIIRVMVETSVGVVIYPDKMEILYGDSLDDIVDKIVEIVEAAPGMPVDPAMLHDVDYVLSHVMIGVQKSSNQKLVKRVTDFDDIESYLYLRFSDDCTMKLTEGIIDFLDVSEEDVWANAEKNTFSIMEIKDMRTVISEMMGMGTDVFTGMDYEDVPDLLCVTNEWKSYGAAAMLDRKILKACADIMVTSKLIVIPSSIHEILVYSGDILNVEEATKMVKEVNATEVLPEQVLADRAYLVNIED